MALNVQQRELASKSQGLVFAVLERFNIRFGQLREDAVAEGMAALCEAVSTYEGDKARFSTWAWLKIHWRLVDWIAAQREHARRCGGELTSDAQEGRAELDGRVPATPSLDAQEGQFWRRVEASLGGDAELLRVVALAIEGRTKDEIALTLGVSVSTVARRRKRARELLFPLKLSIAELEK